MKHTLLILFFIFFINQLFSQSYEIGKFNQYNSYFDASLDDVVLKLYFSDAYHTNEGYKRFFQDQGVDNIWDHDKRVKIYFDLITQISSMSNFESTEVIQAYQAFLEENLWFLEDEQFKNDLFKIIRNMNFGQKYADLNADYETLGEVKDIADLLVDGAKTYSDYVKEELPFYKGFSRASKIISIVSELKNASERTKDIAMAALIKKTFVNEFAKYNFYRIRKILMNDSGASSDPALLEAIENVQLFYENYVNDDADKIIAEAIEDISLNWEKTTVSIIYQLSKDKVIEGTINTIINNVSMNLPAKTIAAMPAAWSFGIIAVEITIKIIQDINEQVNNAQYSILASTIYEWLSTSYNNNQTCSNLLPVIYSAYLSSYYLRLSFDVNLISDIIHNWDDAVRDADYLKGIMTDLVINTLNQGCDALPPYVISFETINDKIVVKFNETILEVSIENSIQLFKGENILEIIKSLNEDELIIQSSSLRPSQDYLLVLTDGIEDLEGNNLDGDKDGFEFGNYTNNFIQNGLIINFQADNNLITEFSNIRFSNISTYSNWVPSSFLWDFGDGITSTLQNPIHTYQTEGTYDVSLTVSDGAHTVTETKNDFITVTAPNYGHDLRLYLPSIAKDWLTPGENLDFYCDVKNVGEYPESDYVLKFQLINSNGEVIEEETEQGVEIPEGQLSPANSNRTLSIASGYPDGFYTFKISVVFPDDYAQGDNSQEFSLYIGDSNPFQTYEMFSDNILLNKGDEYTLAGHTVEFTAHDSENARVYVNGERRDIPFGEFSFFDAYRFNLIYKGYFSSTEAAFVYATPSSSVSFSPQKLTIEAGKTGTFNVDSNEEDPTPNIEVATEGGLDASIVQNWNTNAYTKGTPYTNVYFDITVPLNAERRMYEFWIDMTADGSFFQKLNIEVIDPQPDFDYNLSKNALTIGPDMSEVLTLDLTALNGFNENVVLSFSDIPSGISITPSENNFSLSNTIQLTIDVAEDFAAYDNYTVEMNMVSGSKSKTQNLYINVIDNSKNFLTITDVQYIDKDSKLDSLEIFYNAQFEYASTSVTSNWQYTLNGTDWIDIPPDQILNNAAKTQGDTSIIWNIQDSPILFSETAKFRMKNKNGSDFMTYLGYNNYIGRDYFDANPDYCGITIKDDIMYLVDNDESPMLIRKWNINTNEYLGSNTISQVATTYDVQLVSCYNRFYIHSRYLDRIYYYSSSFGYLGSRAVSEDFDNIFEMEGKLYGFYYADGMSLLKELNSSAAETGNNISVAKKYNEYGSFYDGKNLWIGDHDDFFKYSEDFSTFTSYTLPRDIVYGYCYNGILYGPNGDYEVYKFSFYDPYSFYSESPEFTLNNSNRPILDSVIVINSVEDSTILNAYNLTTSVSDSDTSFDDLEFTLFDVDTNFTVSFNSDTTNLIITPDSNWFGTGFFKIRVQDNFNTVESKVVFNVSPVNDTPEINDIGLLSYNEDDSIIVQLETILFDVDDSLKSLDIEYGFISDLNFNNYIDRNNEFIIFKPSNNYYCDSTLAFIKAIDSSGAEAIDTFYVEVKPVNDAPSEFSKLTPLENLCRNQGDIYFDWTNSFDIEGDSIFYLLTISTREIDTVFITNDSFLAVDIALFDLSNENYSEIYWNVYAYDGVDFSTSGLNENITISNPPDELFLAKSICQGESYQFGTQALTTTGEYTEIFETVNGCDSTVTLTLTVDVCDVPTTTQISSTTLTSGTTDCFNATNTITVAGDGTQVIVESGASADFIAGQSIRFMPGFYAQEGSYVHGHITTTGTYCVETAPAIVAEETTTKEAVIVDAELTEHAEPEMVVYPNPNNGEFTVEFRNFEAEIQVMLFNSIGQMVYNEQTTDKQIRMRVPNLKSGMYFIKAVNKNKQFNQKIVVQ